jgi:hypothetical protein
MTTEDPYIPFSQRTGLKSVPPQLKLGEISSELRQFFEYYLKLEWDRETATGYNSYYYYDKWERVAQDFHVKFLKKSISSYRSDPRAMLQEMQKITREADIGFLFDALEFFVRHPICSAELKGDIAEAFVEARAAYRVIDQKIVAIGSEEQAEAFEGAISATEKIGAIAARTHLVSAGNALRDGDWAASVRESIHAVEAMAILLAPSKGTLGAALAVLEKDGRLHGGLKAAFSALYGYTSDEEGVRHALVFQNEAHVDEADALFMLGACSSFVNYLVSRKPSDAK